MSAPHALPRLLAGLRHDGAPVSFAEHVDQHGPIPEMASSKLIDIVEKSGLRGRGGADFPTGMKLKTLASRRRVSAVIVNGSETEPASNKDRTLFSRIPHLVLDGAILAAQAVGAERIVVKLDQHSGAAGKCARDAVRDRTSNRLPIELVIGPDGYVTGEESAVVNLIDNGVAKPTFVPPRVYDKGLSGRPTLIQNAETLAQLALIARYGYRWFREIGTHDDPGSVLVTISGSVRAPGVYEMAFGTPIRTLLDAAGGPSTPLQAVLVGGYFGSWMPIHVAEQAALSRRQLEAHGAKLGAGVIIALPNSACGLHESARITNYLAGQSAGQCGPCVHGLAAIADEMMALARGAGTRNSVLKLRRWCDEVEGRGACHHPGGVAKFVRSTLEVFATDIETHAVSKCTSRPIGLPLVREAVDHQKAALKRPQRRAQMAKGGRS